MRQLYTDTKRALRRGLENPVNKDDRIEQIQNESLAILQRKGYSEQEVLDFWNMLGEDFFLREQPQHIAWQTQAILEHGDSELPLVMIRKTSYRAFEGATEIFIYIQDLPNLFAATASALDQLHLSIQDARIMVADNNQALNTYTVLTEDNQPLPDDDEFLARIQHSLIEELDDPDDYPAIIQRRIPRQMKLFAYPTQANLSTDPVTQLTTLELITPDRPGLLARLGGIFVKFGISVRKAKIASVGERVEDYFFISDAQGQPISDPELCQQLQHAICQQLDEQIQSE